MHTSWKRTTVNYVPSMGERLKHHKGQSIMPYGPPNHGGLLKERSQIAYPATNFDVGWRT
jgi:hypothetical protein